MKNCIIIGGGLCGLFSSIVLADKFEHVSVIEFDKTCGGLLKSVHDDAGVVYDQGTHIPNTTDIPEIDDISEKRLLSQLNVRMILSENEDDLRVKLLDDTSDILGRS